MYETCIEEPEDRQQKQHLQSPPIAAAAEEAATMSADHSVSAKSVLSDWLSSTSAHGVGQFVKSHTFARRLVWLLLIGVCLSVAGLHLVLLINQYVNYPTTITMSETTLPQTLPDVVICTSELVSVYRLDQMNASAREQLNTDYRRYLNISVSNGSKLGDVSYVKHFKRLFYRLPLAVEVRPRPEDVIIGFTYGSEIEGRFESFHSYLADVNMKLMICYRFFTWEVVKRLNRSNTPVSRETLKLLLFKKPYRGDAMNSYVGNEWAKSEALRLLLQESSEDALELYLADSSDPTNAAVTVDSSRVILTHGRHYDVQVIPVQYTNKKTDLLPLSSECISDKKYYVEDARSKYAVDYGKSVCQAYACAKGIAEKYNCFHPGAVTFSDLAGRYKDCSRLSSDSPSNNEFSDALLLQTELSGHMKRTNVCSGSGDSCQEACTRYKRSLEADSYSWPYLSDSGSQNFSSELKTINYLKAALIGFARAIGNGTSEIVHAYPKGELCNVTDKWYLIRLYVRYYSDSMGKFEVSRKFQIHDLMSDFGGALGVWLGASFLTVSELLVLATSLLQVCMRHRAKGRRPAAESDGSSKGI